MLVRDFIYIMSVKLVRKVPNDVLPFSSFSNTPFTGESKVLKGKCDV
jgi:hypothetical protein